MTVQLRHYKKESEHSYALGVYPTLELLKHRPELALGVIGHTRGSGNAGITKIRKLCRELEIPFEIQDKTFARIGARENDYAAGIFRVDEPGLDPGGNHVILVNPSGMGNLGTIIRTMLGFGFQDLAIIQPAADIFHPDVVRASMGALFQIRFGRFPDFDSYQSAFSRNWYTLMTAGRVSLQAADFTQPFGLIFGNESSGLPPAYDTIGTSLRIPQRDTIDSLNIAVSVGVTLYQVNLFLER